MTVKTACPKFHDRGKVIMTEICNKFIDIKDETCEDRFFEMMR